MRSEAEKMIRPEAQRLHDLAHRVRRLIPCRHGPEHFHVERSDIAHELRRLADRLASITDERTTT